MLILLLFSIFWGANANLVLTYPQARFPPLDFLSSDLTSAPCGVPKPTKPYYTTLHIGEKYNITWNTPSTLKNAKYNIKLIDSDGLTVEQFPESMDDHFGRSSYQMITLKSPCEQCMLLVEQVERCKYHFMKDDEKCGQRGSVPENSTTCQCDNGFTGNQCQYYSHCATDDDCMNGGKCRNQPDSLIQKRCFCSYGFFGQRCDQRFNSQNDPCFAYDEISAADLPRFGMFNPRCYIRHDLSADDQLYSRRLENEVEIIMDFTTTSWISLGWRPTELSTSCRLFPILEDTRGRESQNQMDEMTRRHFVAKQVMPKNNGFTEMGLKSPLHAMDCIDLVMGAVRKGRLFISDFYSRDRSSPLEDYWYDGEMSLSAAYGIEVDGRTIVMFRRELREIEPTDHPLGPNELFVVWAKGDNQMGEEFQYHGKNRGIERLSLSESVNVTFEETLSVSNEIAFGVKNVARDRLVPMSIPTTTTTDQTTTTIVTTKTVTTSITSTTEETTTDDDNSSSEHAFYSYIFILFLMFLI